MQVKFDSLNRFEVPKFTLCNPGTVYRDGITSNAIGILTDTTAEEITFNFNAESKLKFRMSYAPRKDKEADSYVRRIFRSLQNRRYIFVDSIGYFVITNVNDGYANGMDYKDIVAASCEVEIKNKKVPYIEDGTYQFMDLLQMLVTLLPKWTLGKIDSSVQSKYRTFQDVDPELNVLAFFLQNMQDAYECIFVFDTINRQINVYDQNNYVVQTNIHITREDFIESLDVAENADELYTAISVFGDENLNIAPLNPLGTSVIYNFDYYLNWMTSALRTRVEEWSEKIESVREQYYNLNVTYYDKMTERSNLQAELDKQNIVLEMYRQCRDNIVAESSTDRVDNFNEVIIANNGAEIVVSETIADVIAEIDRLIALTNDSIQATTVSIEILAAELEGVYSSIDEIHNSVAITEFFTQEEYDELYDYMFEGSYRDEYITVTNSMTYAQKFQQMKLLYDRAVTQLKKVSTPTQKFSIDVENFLFVKEFESWSEQLEAGCAINVELEQDDVAALFLSAIVINYDDRTLKLTFGNRLNRYDKKAQFENVLGKVSKSSNTINYLKEAIYPIKNGELNEMQEALANSRTLTMSAALASQDEEVVIDGTGYTGRKLLDDGSYDPQQVKLTGRTLVFTDDAWQSCKVAIGEIIFDDETKTYGINAQAIIGDLILGNNLQIKNNDGTDLFTAIDNRITANMSDEYVTQDNFGDVLKQFNSSIEADAEAISQYYKFHSELNGIVTDLSAYIHTGHVADTVDGVPIYGVKLGKEDELGSFSSIFTPEEIAFYDNGGDKVAFLSNKKLNVATVRTTKIELSDDLDDSESNNWQISMEDGFCIRWIG